MQATASRHKIFVHGLVQGIGFRPYVYNLATSLNLSGWVRNNGGIVEIEIEGSEGNIASFLRDLPVHAPPLARISRIDYEICVPRLDSLEFRIENSSKEKFAELFVPSDTATCDECLQELFEPSDRRFQYPFINCVNCGPRFTIIESLPYDRASTTMKSFLMCELCEAEYENPKNRRFHAQPHACSKCGPTLAYKAPFFNGELGTLEKTDANNENLFYGHSALNAARSALLQGQVIAVKGLGGYHLLGNARKAEVVQKIRKLKSRENRPLAVMFACAKDIEPYCFVSGAEKQLLESRERPIVLLKKRAAPAPTLDLDSGVAPELDEIGAMLPYTPLHHLLVRMCDFPLVATSGNENGLPITISDVDALRKFSSCGILFHDREINSGYDDSVQRFSAGKSVILRRARGFAPAEIELPFESDCSILAVGAHLKNTFCLTKGSFARMSQHLGDIDTIECLENYERTLALFEKIFDIQPQAIVHDIHPNYQTTIFAEKLAMMRDLPLIQVQHHHAHAVSVMAEHKISKALCVVFDGLGMGVDGNFWGGEFLLADYSNFERLAHFENIPMPGGETAIRNPWRMALSSLYQLRDGSDDSQFSAFAKSLRNFYPASEISNVLLQIEKNLNAPLTSSCGRLFDAAAAIISPSLHVSYEGQAAMQLEALARKCECSHQFMFDYYLVDGTSCVVKTSSILSSLNESLQSGLPPECAARVFHNTVVQIVVDVVQKLSEMTKVIEICFSGGVFQNTLIVSAVADSLSRLGLVPLFHSTLPTNDGGLSYGQAVSGLSRMKTFSEQRK